VAVGAVAGAAGSLDSRLIVFFTAMGKPTLSRKVPAMLAQGWSDDKLIQGLEKRYAPHKVPKATGATAPAITSGLRPEASPTVLVLVPTRELATQVSNECKLFRSAEGQIVLASLLVGGHDRAEQLDALKKKPQILVATPGRLTEVLELDAKKGGVILSLAGVDILVLDEADKMMAMGFEVQLEAINNAVNPTRQALLFSATFPTKVSCSAAKWLRNPLQFQIGQQQINLNPNTSQVLHVCAEHKKPKKLAKFISTVRENDAANKVRQRSKIMIFCNRQKTVTFVDLFLRKQDIKAACLHGALTQDQREKALNEFKCGMIPILVCTDVAARGLHVRHLPYVVNYDFPSSLETYAHRIGRTGRGDAKGHAYSFFTRVMLKLAPSLVAMFEQAGVKGIDPNLLELCPLAERLLEKQRNGEEESGEEGEEEEEEGGEEEPSAAAAAAVAAGEESDGEEPPTKLARLEPSEPTPRVTAEPTAEQQEEEGDKRRSVPKTDEAAAAKAKADACYLAGKKAAKATPATEQEAEGDKKTFAAGKKAKPKRARGGKRGKAAKAAAAKATATPPG